jgi:hypothetical protein
MAGTSGLAEALNHAVAAYNDGHLFEAERTDLLDGLLLLASIQIRLGRANDVLTTYDRALRLRPILLGYSGDQLLQLSCGRSYLRDLIPFPHNHYVVPSGATTRSSSHMFPPIFVLIRRLISWLNCLSCTTGHSLT